jgi:hypothetical protein
MGTSDKISICFLIGVLLAFYGALIFGHGVYELVTGILPNVILARLHAPVWWGAMMLALGLFYSIRCKYPPAEPEALGCEPLKAAWAGSLTRPRRYCGRLVGGYFHIRNWSSRLSSTSWLRMYSRIAVSSRPTVDTKYPRAQKCCPAKFCLCSPYVRAK